MSGNHQELTAVLVDYENISHTAEPAEAKTNFHRKRNILVASGICVIVVALALGLCLGLGLKHNGENCFENFIFEGGPKVLFHIF